ncbi:hypothetical protein PMAYCL1PPCAC_25807, partial [Pristionchus mayeri]
LIQSSMIIAVLGIVIADRTMEEPEPRIDCTVLHFMQMLRFSFCQPTLRPVFRLSSNPNVWYCARAVTMRNFRSNTGFPIANPLKFLLSISPDFIPSSRRRARYGTNAS